MTTIYNQPMSPLPPSVDPSVLTRIPDPGGRLNRPVTHIG